MIVFLICDYDCNKIMFHPLFRIACCVDILGSMFFVDPLPSGSFFIQVLSISARLSTPDASIFFVWIAPLQRPLPVLMLDADLLLPIVFFSISLVDASFDFLCIPRFFFIAYRVWGWLVFINHCHP